MVDETLLSYINGFTAARNVNVGWILNMDKVLDNCNKTRKVRRSIRYLN